jgi:hypothetical protein
MKSSKNKNIGFIIVLMILILFVVFYSARKGNHKNLNSEISLTEAQVSTEDEIEQQMHSEITSGERVQIPTHHSVGGEAAKETQPQVLFERASDNANQVTQMPVSATEIAQFLEAKDVLNPEAEFRNMQDMRFNRDNEAQNLVGLYIDQQANVKFSIIYQDEFFSNISEESCFRFKNDPIYKYENKQFEVRSNNTGYVAVMVERRWYLRLFIESSAGTVTGRLFRYTNEQWQFVDNVVVAPRRIRPSDLIKNQSLCK